MFHSHNSIHLHRLISIPNINIMHCLTCAKRREFSGMIHWLTINNHPSNPQQPYVFSTSKLLKWQTGWWFQSLWKIWVHQLGCWNSQYMESHKIPRFQTTNQIYNNNNNNNIYIYVSISGWFTNIFLWFSYGYIPIYSLWYSLLYPVSCFNKKIPYITTDISPINHR